MDKKVLKWNFIFQYGYVVTNIINSLILLPFYLHKIDTATLGVWLATGNILAWMTLIDPGIGEVLQQKIAELRGKNEYDEVSRTIGSGLIASAGILILAVIAGFVFYSLIGVIINKDVSQYPNLQVALLLSIIATGMSLTSFSISGINQGFHNASQVAISSIAGNILFLLVNITLLLIGFGIISIAFANLCRAFLINIYNLGALRSVLKKQDMSIKFEKKHFKKFIKIFSFTSAASIIGGFSASMDTIVLARFIPPSMITIFEINKRPIQLTQSLIGRHSVALMPSVSHAVGLGDKASIAALINKQFKFYIYVALVLALLFAFTYHDLIAAWTGEGKYAGTLITYLLLANFFFYLLGYFMNNMGYAVGDIKLNSMVSILKGLLMGVCYYVTARYYGIPGLLIAMLAGNICIDASLYSYRLIKLKYLQTSFIKYMLKKLLLVTPCLLLSGWLCDYTIGLLFSPGLHTVRLLLNGGLSFVLYMAILLAADRAMRSDITNYIRFYLKMKSQARHV